MKRKTLEKQAELLAKAHRDAFATNTVRKEGDAGPMESKPETKRVKKK